MAAAVGELYPRAGDQVFDSAGDKDLGPLRQGRDIPRMLDRHAVDAIGDEINFAGVDASPELEPAAGGGITHGSSAADGPAWHVERREDAGTVASNEPTALTPRLLDRDVAQLA
jgi:hypothetical protein